MSFKIKIYILIFSNVGLIFFIIQGHMVEHGSLDLVDHVCWIQFFISATCGYITCIGFWSTKSMLRIYLDLSNHRNEYVSDMWRNCGASTFDKIDLMALAYLTFSLSS